MGLRINEDGKFIDRLVPAIIGAIFAAGGVGIAFWKETSTIQAQAAMRLDRVEQVAAELKATDIAISVRLDALRDLAGNRQEVIVTRLARMEAILERLEKKQP